MKIVHPFDAYALLSRLSTAELWKVESKGEDFCLDGEWYRTDPSVAPETEEGKRMLKEEFPDVVIDNSRLVVHPTLFVAS